MIILVCQHGNSDVNVGLLVTLACSALIAFRRSRDVVLWLCALLLGLGVLAKTTPLVLAPLLAPGARLASPLGRALGLVLLLLPATAGLAVLLALVPRDRGSRHRVPNAAGELRILGRVPGGDVLNDRFRWGTILALAAAALAIWLWPRVRGRSALSTTERCLLVITLLMLGALVAVELLDRLTPIDARSRYDTLFTIGVISLVVWLSYRLWREPPLAPESLFLLVAVIFMLVVTFGPGYGAHYAPWFIPALVATYVLLDDGWRRLLLVGYAVAAVTYVVEYAFIPFLGGSATPFSEARTGSSSSASG